MIQRLLFVLRRRWLVLVLLPVVGAAVGLAFTPRGEAVRPIGYSSDALIAVDQAATNSTEVQQTLLEAEQGSIAKATAEAMGAGTSTEDVGRRVTGSFDDESFTVTLSVSGRIAGEAERYARAVSSTFIEEGNAAPATAQADALDSAIATRDQAADALTVFLQANEAALANPPVPASVQADQQQLEQARQAAEANLSQLRADAQSATVYRLIDVENGGLSTASKLELPASRTLRVSLGFLFGLIGAVVLVALVEKLNPRIDDPDQASELIGAPILAMVPVMNRRRHQAIERADPHEFRGPFAESFRSMRTHLDFQAAQLEGGATPRIMITSATPEEGKSTTTAFLALSYAEAERHPIVVGADLRRPSIHKFLGIDRVPGLTSRAATGGEAVALDQILKRDEVSGVSIIPSAPAVDGVAGLLGDLSAVTDAARAVGRVVLVDTPPVMVANDATDFLVAIDWVVVVVRVGRSTARSIKQTMQTLRLNRAKVVGVVMVGSLESSDAKRYYYSYYDDAKERKARARTVALAASDGAPVPVTGSIDPEP